MTTILALLGLCAGVGIVAIAHGLAPATPSLEEVLDRLDPVGTSGSGPSRAAGGAADSRRASLGERIISLRGHLSTEHGISEGSGSRLARDLAITRRDRTAYAASVATGALAGGAISPALAALAVLVGIDLSLLLPLAGCLALAVVGALVPDLLLRREADRERLRFRQALACWLELVALGQAAGMGIESALHTASSISPDDSFSRIGTAIELARHAGRTPWAGLAQLGWEIGVGELEELGATLMLAGTEGARVRGSLVAKSASMRQRALSAAESDANATTERLFLPAIVLMFGFLVFVGYPAIYALTHAL